MTSIEKLPMSDSRYALGSFALMAMTSPAPARGCPSNDSKEADYAQSCALYSVKPYVSLAGRPVKFDQMRP